MHSLFSDWRFEHRVAIEILIELKKLIGGKKNEKKTKESIWTGNSYEIKII